MGNTCLRAVSPVPLSDEIEKISIHTPPLIQIPSIECLPDGITLIWLDVYAGKSCSEDNQTVLQYLRQLNVASIRLCNDVKSCLSLIKSVSDDEKSRFSRIFLIVSGAFSSQILPELKLYPIVDSVFIFCINQSKYIDLINEYKPLLIDICMEIVDLYNCIDKRIEELNELTLVFHFFAQEQNSTRNLTKDSASFIWFQLFEMIISELKCTENDMNIMLNYCIKQLKKDENKFEKDLKSKKMLKEIERFRKTYKSEDSIFWYTKESFIYHLLNRALRTEDIESLYIFRYFLADLCRQLKSEHKKFHLKYNQSSILKVYRGGHIPSEELENLKRTINNLTSLNGFISTSMKESVAMQFIKNQSLKQNNMEKVLFIIKVNIQSEHIICAYIGHMSAQKDEEEVLFNIGSVFYINEVIFDDEQQISKVYMTATEDGIKAAEDYVKLIRQELRDKSVSIIFGQLFLQMGNYPMAQKYFSDLLQYCKYDHRDYPSICYHLALTDGYQGNLYEAEDRLKEVFQCYVSLQSNHLDLARTKNGLGWIYHHSGELDDAIAYYNEALTFGEEGIGLNHLINGQTCSFLGDCYLEKVHHDEAEMFYKQALEIESLHLPSNHPRIGVTHNDLGNVFRKRKDMKKAMEYYEKAELIFYESLPNFHPYTAYCWSCIGFVYLYQGEIEKAQEYHRKALRIYRRVLPADHINIKTSEKNSECIDFEKISDNYVKICAQV